ncbi:hypothetical protein EYF80_017332 [Liparis tanakae]|uniref:Uncharacterized protein n=1 Tax=Liparis tanakae TaxID=230148 RepID=A0A4Z2I2V4_9TELE|nr:hypothetical protein EYF80_017332 [Liparis tanakae]
MLPPSSHMRTSDRRAKQRGRGARSAQLPKIEKCFADCALFGNFEIGPGFHVQDKISSRVNRIEETLDPSKQKMCSKHSRALARGDGFLRSSDGHGLGLSVILESTEGSRGREDTWLMDIFKLYLGDGTFGCLNEWSTNLHLKDVKQSHCTLHAVFNNWVFRGMTAADGTVHPRNSSDAVELKHIDYRVSMQ